MRTNKRRAELAAVANSPFFREAVEPDLAAGGRPFGLVTPLFTAFRGEAAQLEFDTPHFQRVPSKRISPTTDVPWRWICQISVADFASDKPLEQGTGFLISNRHVLTAAHVVRDVAKGMQRYTVTVIPAYDDGQEPFDHSVAKHIRVSPKYSDAEQTEWDYALITLESSLGKNIANDQRLGFWGSREVSPNFTFGPVQAKSFANAFASGYPRAHGGRTLWCARGYLQSSGSNLMRTLADVTPGQSGSPIWIEDGDRRVVLGVAVLYTSANNVVRRITQDMLGELRAWIKEDGEIPALPQAEPPTSDPSSPATHEVSQPAIYTPATREASTEENNGIALQPHSKFDFPLQPGITAQTDLEELEFRVDLLPPAAKKQFARTEPAAWVDAVAAAISAGVHDSGKLADLIFFMHHRDRLSGAIGRSLSAADDDFAKLRAEWDLYEIIATQRLNPSSGCSVFLPEKRSADYEAYINAPTTGAITLLVNGRTGTTDQTEAFDSMQRDVESLNRGDAVFLSAFVFNPTQLTLKRSDISTWGQLLCKKAEEGVKIRVLLTDFPAIFPYWKSDLKALDAMVPEHARDNLKYVVSMHPARYPLDGKAFTALAFIFPALRLAGPNPNVATHHQKFMIVKKGKKTIAYCGGLDISPERTPELWGTHVVWHDIHARLEGRIARDLEREFIQRWNREKDKSTTGIRKGWSGLEPLAQGPIDASDLERGVNTQNMQMLRTVSVGPSPKEFRRDDIWRTYFRIIGCATRFLVFENQYFQEPALADAIVAAAQANPNLIVLIVVAFEIDDPKNPITMNGLALQNEFFTRLKNGMEDHLDSRLGLYTMRNRIVHSKLIMADDQYLSVGSLNADPRDFFMDTQLNVALDDPAVRAFRVKLWAHDLGADASIVGSWKPEDFLSNWNAVALKNELLKATPQQLAGEGVIRFDPTTVAGAKLPIANIDVLSETEAEPESAADEEGPSLISVPREGEVDAGSGVSQGGAPGAIRKCVGQRVDIDLATSPFASTFAKVRWSIPGRYVRGYDGTARDALLFEVEPAELERPRISFFWVDAGVGRVVRAKITTKDGTEQEWAVLFDVEGPTVNSFTVHTGETHIKERGKLADMQFGTPRTAPGVRWCWKVTLPGSCAGHIKDVQTVLSERWRVESLGPSGGTRKMVWRNPKHPRIHRQLDGDDAGRAVYTAGLLEPLIDAGKPFDNGSGTEDSPGTELPFAATSASVNEQFTYYLMFQPGTADPHDAIFVPIARAKWTWKVSATHAHGKWSVEPEKTAPTIDKTSLEFPIYESNVSDNEWLDESELKTAP